MATKKKLGSAKKFGARYGKKLKRKVAEIELEQKKLYKCPYCNHMKVKRVSYGIWQCKKCGSKFTSKAYHVTRKINVKGV